MPKVGYFELIFLTTLAGTTYAVADEDEIFYIWKYVMQNDKWSGVRSGIKRVGGE
jgi:hypothetical protein